jgi:hypothetical protein
MNLQLRYPNARFCSVFVNQLLEVQQQFGLAIAQCITEELDWLEGLKERSDTKQPTKFNGPVLGGLMHKHFFTANSIPTNVKNRLLGKNGSLEDIIVRTFAKHGTDVATPEAVVEVLEKIKVGKLLEQRAKRCELTGDWIIYEQKGLAKTYLCLAEHSETNESILERFEQYAKSEFPDLQFWARNPNAA